MDQWQPSCSLSLLQQRARLLEIIRNFFKQRGVLEVETPLLGHHTVTDPFIQSFAVPVENKTYYLQTSPEYAMKRLLAAGSGCIYQICKAFRCEESGSYHNPEFTLLEWYRIGYDHQQLMDEVDALLQLTLNSLPGERISYQDLFLQTLDIDPLAIPDQDLIAFARSKIRIDDMNFTREDWLQLLMSHCIEPYVGQSKPLLVFDFPAAQAALARISREDPRCAHRFEVYYQGLELANGFYELNDKSEQLQRFKLDLHKRNQLNCREITVDSRLLAALAHGLPDCAGVALGIDRLLMLATGQSRLSEVISFPIKDA